jgi:thioredoxin reductase (NADPH)
MGNVSEQVRDVIIIGSGPAGYTAAIYAARAELKPLLFEGSRYGGVLMTTTDVENYPGFRDGITGPDLMEQFRAQAERFGTQLQSKDVTSVDLTGDLKQVMVDDTTYLARSVILAMGAQPRYLHVPGEQELLGRGVSSCATCDGFFFHDEDVAVIGGGDSAMEEAMFLTKFARSVTVVHRRHEFRASKIMLERARSNGKIRWRTGVTVQQVHGDSGVSHLELSDGSTLDVSGMFVAIGHGSGQRAGSRPAGHRRRRLRAGERALHSHQRGRRVRRGRPGGPHLPPSCHRCGHRLLGCDRRRTLACRARHGFARRGGCRACRRWLRLDMLNPRSRAMTPPP